VVHLLCAGVVHFPNAASNWRDPDSERAGNTIDFCVLVLGMTFNQAMEAITR